jgi:ribonuclease BN (tRNA processing enzyme)
MIFTTLGTMGGPVANPQRSQPAHLLHDNEQAILIDAGDGTIAQLTKAGVSLAAVHTLILSHGHIDHTGGLFAVLGTRFQEPIAGELTIYGPPGTQQMIDGIIAGLQPLARTMSAQVPTEAPNALQCNVIEITDGSLVTIGSTRITAATNTHYTFKPGSKNAFLYQSLSYRFDMPDRSLVYTGDTGPSPNVERLAHNVDLLVSEVIDPQAGMNKARKSHRIPFYVKPILMNHLKNQHLTAEAVGSLAHCANVKALVLIHNALDTQDIAISRRTIGLHYHGPITFASDLESF